MGEVYRARDSRLGREVALKVLTEETSGDTERLQRLEQEARAASSLDHPNLVVVHDIGEARLPDRATPVRYLVMELLTGEVLSSLLANGPLKLRSFLDLAVQLADGLAAAHEAGLVHRDLKPSNIVVSSEGHVKILDFGLAKIVAPHGGESSAPTGDSLTLPGEVLGTVGYMSPEQVRGEPATAASDQFSLGCVFYQMLTGRRPFRRPSRAETLSAVLRDDPPPIAEANPAVPAPVCWVVERCLAKNPRARYVSTRDLAGELATLREHASDLSSGAFRAARSRRSVRVSWLGAAAALAVAGGGLVGVSLLVRHPAQPEPPYFHRLTWQRGTVESARFAPDGQTVLFSAAWDGKPPAIYIKRPDSPDAVALDLPSAMLLAISRSGEVEILLRRRGPYIGIKRGTLARATLTGGTPRELSEDVTAADSGPDGRLLVARHVAGKASLEYPLGKVLYEPMGHLSYPRFSPKGDLVAFVDHPVAADDRGSIAVVDLQGKKRTLSREFGSVQGLAWSPSGDEVWFTAHATETGRWLWGVTLEGRLRVVSRLPGEVRLQDVTRSGRVLLTRGDLRVAIRWLPPGDVREREVSWFGLTVLADLSPDGRSIVFEEEGGPVGPNYAVCLFRTDGTPVRLGEGNAGPLSPDGKWVLSRHPKPGAPIVLLPTGPGEPKPVEAGGLSVDLPGWAWFPDGKRLLLVGHEGARGPRQLFVLNLDGDKPHALTGEEIGGPTVVSPDGKAVVAAGPDQKLRLVPVDGGEPRPVLGADEGDLPIQWSADGRSLYVHRRPELFSPARVFLLNLKSGKRVLWKELYPEDPSGVLAMVGVRIAPDGRSYAYSYSRLLSDLYLVEGLR
jgi:Tol biopolymer transport system component